MGWQAYNLLSHPLPLPYTQAGGKCSSLHFFTQSLRPNGLNNKLTEQQTGRTGGQGRPAPIHTPTPLHTQTWAKNIKKHLFPHLSTHAGDQQTDGRTKPFISCVSAAKKGKVGQSVRWVECQTNALVTDQPTNQLTQPLIDKHCSLSLILFSRGHATLHLAMSVGR